MPDAAHRRAAAAIVIGLASLLAGCDGTEGRALPECAAAVADVPSQIAEAARHDPRAVPIECYREVDRRRVLLLFEAPAGPDCFGLERVELRESGDAVAITLVVSRRDEPASGACPSDAADEATVVELQAPLADRMVRDGSGLAP